MEVEMVVPVDFNFDSNCSSPFITAPSSPQRFASNSNFFFSAPTSPTRPTPFFFHDSPSSSSSVPFLQEQQPQPNANHNHDDFEFNSSGHLDRPFLSADELFLAGKIRPLKPPTPTPPLRSPSPVTSPRRKKDFDRLAEATKETRRGSKEEEKEEEKNHARGRQRVLVSGRKGSSRSLSPLRISDIVCDSENISSFTSNSKSPFLASISFTRKWKFRDFLLFRSASEGRTTNKNPLKKYVILSKNEDVRNSSFRSAESSGSVSKRRGPVSAHELHYTVNRAASEEMKKKTFLPYKQGLLGCLGFNPGMHHISKAMGPFTRS
ncbi:uncharacterized protein LOC124819488 [Vigna umbellata]|uniref:uncharacterized protein LOC124819488 n=1 Tax=Vigna umbellata TaxID=87088 RepID=UPI001F5FA118|nr:uncharacterized protein LOC124819488 [Vigna umbellata]